jgi:hypothetical protein
MRYVFKMKTQLEQGFLCYPCSFSRRVQLFKYLPVPAQQVVHSSYKTILFRFCLVVVIVPAIIVAELLIAASSQGLGAADAIPGGYVCCHAAKLLQRLNVYKGIFPDASV